MREVYVQGQRIKLEPRRAIGKGFEADVYDVGGDTALKVYKPPSHPDYQGQPLDQQAAAERLTAQQQKLPAFPRGLPPRVIAPRALATDRSGQQVLGYTMRLLRDADVLMRYADRGFRQAGVPASRVLAIFRDLHDTVAAVHRAGVTIGDFNDLNVLVRDTEAHVIDADSFQFGPFPCTVFNVRFADPLLCDLRDNQLVLVARHGPASDWYAYTVMLMQCLLFVDPYGGVYLPKNPADRVPPGLRPLRRITVFHPEVRYPKPALPYRVLPDDLLQHLQQTFERDRRGEFPRPLLDSLRWTTCSACGGEHARGVCPHCTQAAPWALPEVTTVRGEIVATRTFATRGLILYATLQHGRLRWLYHEDDQYRREDGTVVASGRLVPGTRFRIQGPATLLGRQGHLLTLAPGQAPGQLAVDSCGTLPTFDANQHARYWAAGGQLRRDGAWDSELIGQVLAGQTLFWVGPSFGFGFYRAGSLAVAFVFDARRTGLNDTVALPPLRGQLVDATCVFTDSRCWLFVATRADGKTTHCCAVITADGATEALADAEAGDGSWLGTLRGKYAVGRYLFSPTDEGIVRVELRQGQLVQRTRFADSEPFVDSACRLFGAADGVYVVQRQAIWLLKRAGVASATSQGGR
jgi:H/ACA ribonucleoprotein complex subunit 3